MSKKLRVLLASVRQDNNDADFSVIPLSEKLLQSVTGADNAACTNQSCSGSNNTSCTNTSCSNTRNQGCKNQ